MAHKTITIQGDGIRREFVGSGEITPGHLVEITSATADTVKAHDSADQNAYPLFAVEDDLQGKEISDVYADGKRVQANMFSPGDVIFGLVTNGQTGTKGNFAVSGGDGGLKNLTAITSNSDGTFDEGGETIYTNAIVGVFLETVDMSDSSEADPASARIKVLIV